MSEALRLAALLNEGAWHAMRLGDVEAAGRELRRLAGVEAELQTLREERTEWRVTAENAEEKKTQLQEFSKLACRALDDCSRVLSTIEDAIDYDEIDRIKELDSRVSSLAVQALVLNGLTHGGQLDEAIDASLEAAVKQARIDALEEAAIVCDKQVDLCLAAMSRGGTVLDKQFQKSSFQLSEHLARRVRSLKGKT